MRSERPKPLHRLCGKPMLMYVVESLADVQVDRAVDRGGPRGRLGHQEDAGAPAPRSSSTSSSSACSAAPATPRWSAWSGLPDERRRGRRAGPARRHAAAAARDHRRAGRPPPQHRRRRRPCSPPCMDDPTGYGRVVRGRDDRVVRIVEQARRHRRGAGDRTRSTPRSTASGASLLAPALRRIEPDNSQGEYYLTDVVEVLAAAGYPVEARRRRRPGRDPGRQRPPAAGRGRGRAASAHQRGAAALGRHHGRPGRDLRRHHRRRSVATSPCSRAPSSRAPRVVGDGTELGPNTRLVDCVVGAELRRRADDRPRRRGRRRRAVGPYAVARAGQPRFRQTR